MMKRILYIEDSVTAQRIFQKMFSPPHEVVIAAGLAAGRECLATGRFDLVVSDFLFPQGDAFDLLTPLRHRFPPLALPFIAVSGSMDQALAARLLVAGANTTANKPLINAEFRDLVGRMLATPFVEPAPAGVITVGCFQWVQDGVHHEHCPEAGLHLTGENRAEVSARMQAALHRAWLEGASLGRATQERAVAYTLRPHRADGVQGGAR